MTILFIQQYQLNVSFGEYIKYLSDLKRDIYSVLWDSPQFSLTVISQ